MTYGQFITQLRRELKDLEKIHRDRWDGDGETTLFQVNHIPIRDASYTVKVGGVEQTENTDYTLDKYTGILSFTTPPAAGSDNVEMTYKSVIMKDDEYIQAINDAIDHFQWTFWDIGEDEGTITSVKNQYEYDLSSISDNILYILRVWYKKSGDTYWRAVQGYTNWRYYAGLNKLYVDPPFSEDGYSLKFKFIKSFTKGSSTSDDLNIPTKWLVPYKFFCYAKFYERQVPQKIAEVGAVQTTKSFLPGPSVMTIADYYYNKADQIARRLAPKLPPIPIRTIKEGVAL